jgi:hypothetical protein
MLDVALLALAYLTIEATGIVIGVTHHVGQMMPFVYGLVAHAIAGSFTLQLVAICIGFLAFTFAAASLLALIPTDPSTLEAMSLTSAQRRHAVRYPWGRGSII